MPYFHSHWLSVLLACGLLLVLRPAFAAPLQAERIPQRMKQQLLAAIQHQDLKTVTSLLEQGAEVNFVDDNLLNLQGKPYPRRYMLLTPLMEAIINGRECAAQTRLIQALLDHGADPNARGFFASEKASPITVALKYDLLATVYQLLKQGANPNLMISKGFPIGGVEWKYITMPLFHYFLCGMWLHFSEADRIALLAAMLAHRAQPNRRAANGNTALLWATESHLWDAVPLLLAHHVDVNAKNKYGETALCFSVSDPATVRLLLSKGAKVNVRTGDGKTPLELAASHVSSAAIENTIAVMHVLISSGAAVNIKDRDGETALSELRDQEQTLEVQRIIALLKRAGAIELPVNRRRHEHDVPERM